MNSRETVKELLKEYLPDVSFSDFEVRRIEQFLRPAIKAMMENQE